MTADDALEAIRAARLRATVARHGALAAILRGDRCDAHRYLASAAVLTDSADGAERALRADASADGGGR